MNEIRQNRVCRGVAIGTKHTRCAHASAGLGPCFAMDVWRVGTKTITVERWRLAPRCTGVRTPHGSIINIMVKMYFDTISV